MREFIAKLNANSGAIQAICAFLIFLVTAIYVWFTARMWREMRRTNERLEQPNVQVILQPGRTWGSLFELVIRNSGNVPVRDVRLEVSPKNILGLNNKPLVELSLFRTPLSNLIEGQEIKTILFNYRSLIGSKNEGNGSTKNDNAFSVITMKK